MPRALPALPLLVTACAHLRTGPLVVPTRYEEDRFFAVLAPAAGGEPLEIYLDTGGNNVLYEDIAARLGLEPRALGEGDSARQEVPWPALAPGTPFPPISTREGRVLLRPRGPLNAGWSGMLGPEWFGGRCWLFDYPGRRFALLPRCAISG